MGQWWLTNYYMIMGIHDYRNQYKLYVLLQCPCNLRRPCKYIFHATGHLYKLWVRKQDLWCQEGHSSCIILWNVEKGFGLIWTNIKIWSLKIAKMMSLFLSSLNDPGYLSSYQDWILNMALLRHEFLERKDFLFFLMSSTLSKVRRPVEWSWWMRPPLKELPCSLERVPNVKSYKLQTQLKGKEDCWCSHCHTKETCFELQGKEKNLISIV